MRCPNCGTDNPAGAKYCGACGASLADAAKAQETAVATKPVEVTPTPAVTASNSHVTISKNALILGVVLLLAVIGGIIAYTTVSSRVNIEDYFLSDEDVEYVGANGFADCTSSPEDFILAQALYCELYDVKHDDLAYAIENDLASDYYSFYDFLVRNIAIEVDSNNYNLSNGDTFTVYFLPDYEAINAYTQSKKTLLGDARIPKTYTVVGLPEAIEFDPLAYIKHVYTLTDDGKTDFTTLFETKNITVGDYTMALSVYSRDEWKWDVRYKDDVIDNYSVVVNPMPEENDFAATIKTVENENYLKEYGIGFSKTVKELPLEKVSFVNSPSALTPNDWKKCQKLVAPYLEASDVPIALYFEIPTTISFDIPRNILHVVIQKTDGERVYYQTYRVYNLFQDEDGKIIWGAKDWSDQVQPALDYDSVEAYKGAFSGQGNDTATIYDVSSLLTE